MDDNAAREVVAMQFAGGISIARLAEQWERDAVWVEEAVRQALLASIPKRFGGLKEARVAAIEAEASEQDGQGELEFVP